MKRFPLLASIWIVAVQLSYSQTAESFYKKGDSLNKLKEYSNAAGIRYEGNDADLNRHWMAAKAWSLAMVPDSAFSLLNTMAKSDRISPSDATGIENDKDFSNLEADKRWSDLLSKAKACV